MQVSVLGLLVLSSLCCCRAFTSPSLNPGFIGDYSYPSHTSASLKVGQISRPSRCQLSAVSLPSDPLGPDEVLPSKQLRKKALQTFPRYLEIECWKQPSVRGLEPVLQAVAEACKQINRIVQRAQTDDVYGVAVDAAGNPLEDTNVQGEVQQKLDVLCNTIMMRAFCGSSGSISSVASEEEDEPRCCEDVMVRALHVVDSRLKLDVDSYKLPSYLFRMTKHSPLESLSQPSIQ
jgi:hypothetical protein